MAYIALSSLVALASLTLVNGQATTSAPAANPAVPTFPTVPLTDIRYAYDQLPEQVVTSTFVRGTQTGYNKCNSSTQNQQSMCQTAIVNNISDFCFYAPPQANSSIADTEADEVTWCVKSGWGSRGVPPNTITGIQVLNTADYIQVVAFINQVNVNMQVGDYGGELDCGGQDGLGNPMGGMVYGYQNGTTPLQYPWWTEFIGGNIMAIKVCNPNGPNPAGYCQHTLDRIGIAYNMPNNAQNGTFEMCDSDPMDIPGEYVVNGQTSSYAQPPESVSIGTLPFTPRIPASSNCVTYQSSALYTDFKSLAASPTASSAASGTGASKSTATGSHAGSAPASATSGSNGAGALTVSLFSGVLGVAFSIAFVA